MSIHVMSIVWKDKTLTSHADLLVMLALADFSNDEGDEAWPSLKTLSKKCRMSERGLRYTLRRLESNKRIISDTGSGRQTTKYRIILEGHGVPPSEGHKLCPPEGHGVPPRGAFGGSPNKRSINDPSLNQKGGVGQSLEEYLGYQSRLCVLMGRPANGILRGEEERLLADLIRERPDFETEFVLVSGFKEVCRKDGKKFAESLQSLLERWQVIVDRANNYQPNQEPIHVQIKRLEDCIATHPANIMSVYHKRDCSEKDQADLRDKRQKLKSLKRQ